MKPLTGQEARAAGDALAARAAAAAAGGKGGGEARERPDRDDFFALMFLGRCKHEMGEDTEAVFRRADEAWVKNKFVETDQLFGYRKVRPTLALALALTLAGPCAPCVH